MNTKRLLFILISLSFIFGWRDALSGRQVDVWFLSADNTKLAGTLLLPQGKGPFPAVVFIHGSGPEPRDNSRDRARQFVKNGFAALIYDKRGVGRSEGSKDFPNYFSFTTLAEDAAAAAKFLSGRPDISSDKIGLIGQSQGGWVAPLAATYFPSTAFMIIVSGSVSTVAEDNVFERSARLKKEGFNESEIDTVNQMHLLDLEVSRTGQGFGAFAASWDRHKNARWFKRVYPGDMPLSVDHTYRLWYRSVMDFDPRPFLQQLNIPVLFLYGDAGLDRFCPVTLSLERLDRLKTAGKDVTTLVVENADHSLYVKKKDMASSAQVFAWLKSKT